MKEVLFQNAQRIIKQVLDFFQSAKSEAITERIDDSWGFGAVEGQLSNMNIVGKDLDALLVDFFSVKVDTGVAYKTGERILISDSTITFNASNPSNTTDDGLGNFVSTPQSTGSFDITLTTGSVNFLYIAYLQTADTTTFTLHKIINAKQFYKREDGFEIAFNITGVNPDASRFIFIGQVDLTGGNQAVAANISIAGRDIFRSKTRRIGIETANVGKTDRPSTYALGNNNVFLDDHVKSVGTGAVSPTNPHGLALPDLGVLPNQTVEVHRRSEHTNGIIAGTAGTPLPTASGLFAERVVVSPGEDFITVRALISGEIAIVDGLGFDFTDFGSDVNITFSAEAANTFEIFFDSTTGTVGKTTSNIDGDTTKLKLATVTWNGVDDLTLPLERRQFGTSNRLQRWTTAGRPPIPISGNFGYNLDANRPEYFNGSIWVQL